MLPEVYAEALVFGADKDSTYDISRSSLWSQSNPFFLELEV